jgi:DNA invertase Pin-like site-specific DNA recombinase
VRRCILLVVDGTNRGELVELARNRSWAVQRTLEVSSSTVRRGLEELRLVLHQGSTDAVIVDSVRFPGMPTIAVLRELAVVAQLGVELLSAREPWLSTAGAQGTLIQWIVDGVDRDQSAKIKASLARATAEGRPLGRPRAVIPTQRVLEMRAAGASLRAIARAVGLGAATIHRFLSAHDQVAQATKSRGR